MTRHFTMISPDIWRSRKFRNLPSDDHRYFFFYLLTNRHQTSAGVYHLPDGYASADLGGWPQESVREKLQGLNDAKLIRFDPTTGELLIEGWFRYCLPANDKHKVGVERAIEAIQSSQLREFAKSALAEAWAEAQERKQRDAKANITSLARARQFSR